MCNNANTCSRSGLMYRPVPRPAVLICKQTDMTAPPQHWRGTQLWSNLHYQTQLPSVNNSHVGEGHRLLRAEASRSSTGLCLSLSHHIIETQNSKDMSNYLALCKHMITILTESTHFGEQFRWNSRVQNSCTPPPSPQSWHFTSIGFCLNEVAFCLWKTDQIPQRT